MLTPAFELTQNANFLIASLRIPYAKITDAEVYFENYDFKFYCKPYFLKLNLPGKVLFTEEPSVTYNADTGVMVIEIPKATPKEMFEDLDLITKLLAPKTTARNTSTPKIEVIGGTLPKTDEDGDDDFNWEIEQPVGESESILQTDAKCGFANLYSSSVFRLKDEVSEIFDVIDFHVKSPAVRSKERLQLEESCFSDDYYLENLYNDEEIQLLISYKPEWNTLFSEGLSNINKNVHFTSEEKERLRRLPNKEYLLEKSEIQVNLLSLIDIIFAFAYNKRTLMGENNVESAWTINKLSATLSNLGTFSSLRDAILSPMRRSLCYPLFRHWNLSQAVFNDTVTILSLGQKYVLKCFLEIHELFCHSDPRYILNDLYITDYCVWIQEKSCHSKVLLMLAEALKKVEICKRDMNLDLEELELGAQIALQEDLTKDMTNMNLQSKDVMNKISGVLNSNRDATELSSED